VLADFEQGVKNKFKKNVDELNQGMMWGVINKSNTFFETLPWMPKGRELWSQIEQYNPIILTGVPRSSSSAVEQKIRWCKRELGPNVKVITCATKDKPKYCIDKSILIDDRTDNLKPWIVRGGKFILYDEDYLDDIVERIGRHMECELPSP
jgi:5'(3')-deoxyribonucleotidase